MLPPAPVGSREAESQRQQDADGGHRDAITEGPAAASTLHTSPETASA